MISATQVNTRRRRRQAPPDRLRMVIPFRVTGGEVESESAAQTILGEKLNPSPQHRPSFSGCGGKGMDLGVVCGAGIDVGLNDELAVVVGADSQIDAVIEHGNLLGCGSD
jgi:hypothetical protein